MTLSKTTVKLLIIWFTIVCLASVNTTVYALNTRLQQDYAHTITKLEQEIATKRIALVRETRQSAPTHASTSKTSAEDQVIINALNSGEVVADTTSPNKKNCTQFERDWRRFTDANTCAFVLAKAVGDLKLLIVEFASPDFNLNQPEYKAFYDAINNESAEVTYNNVNQTTFRYLKPYFEKEAEKFNADVSLTVDKTQLIPLDDYPPYEGKSRQEQLREINKSQQFFLEELKKAKLDLRDYDAIAITVFSPKPSEFISFALPWIRANITKITANNYSLDYDVSVLAHETAHLFGTSDQYIEGSGNCQDNTRDEYVSGTFESLMCRTGTINLISPYKSVINARAAKEMGWLGRN